MLRGPIRREVVVEKKKKKEERHQPCEHNFVAPLSKESLIIVGCKSIGCFGSKTNL